MQLLNSEIDLINSLNKNLNRFNFQNKLPVEVVEENNDWEVLTDQYGSFMKKNYKFGMLKHLLYFVNESLTYANNYSHYPEILIKNEKEVEVTLFTKDINDISEIDLKLSKALNDIYAEIKILYTMK